MVAYLLGRLETGADVLRLAALWVIGALGTSSPRAYAVLESRLADPSLRVRYARWAGWVLWWCCVWLGGEGDISV